MVQGWICSERTQACLRLAYRLLRGAALPYHWLRRPLSLGVRAFVLDAERRLLLVKHGYLPGWHLPGGGVKRGETVAQAIRRELIEETGFAAEEETLFGLYRNPAEGREDHVAMFVVGKFRAVGERTASRIEIVDSRFFPLDALPADISPATRRRIDEYLGGRSAAPEW